MKKEDKENFWLTSQLYFFNVGLKKMLACDRMDVTAFSEGNMDIRAVVLIDNIAEAPLESEWGLSVYIEYRGRRILLDTGASGKFLSNAKRLGVDISSVSHGVLSHAHYDHADGMDAFFDHCSAAKFYLRSGTEENCYSGEGSDRHYIGVRQGMLSDRADRIIYADGDHRLFEGAWLIPHKYDMEQAGKNAHMYLLDDGAWKTDCFAHEQSLVLETEKGLVIFNSCCHGGADVIIKEVSDFFGGKKIHALIGGLHLFRSDDGTVLDMAHRLSDSGIGIIYTGHCTGDRGFQLLKQVLGGRIMQIYSGMNIEL